LKHTIFIHFMNEKTESITYADKIELLNVGEGVLSVIKGNANFCYPLFIVQSYMIQDEEE